MMRHRRPLRPGFLALAALFCLTVAPSAQAQYTLTTLTYSPNGNIVYPSALVTAYGINNVGQIAGGVTFLPYVDQYSTYTDAFLYDTRNGEVSQASPLWGPDRIYAPGTSSFTSINDSGLAVGSSMAGYNGSYFTNAMTFQFSAGSISIPETNLDATHTIYNVGANNYGTAINAAGYIVGYGNPDSGATGLGSGAFLLAPGSQINWTTDLIPPAPGFTTLSMTATAINNLNQVVGTEENNTNTAQHGYLYRNGQTIDLLPTGYTNSYATGINDNGQIALYAAGNTSYEAFRVTVDANNNVTFVDLGPGTTSGINANGDIIGENGAAPIVWLGNGTTLNLSNLFPTTWKSLRLTGINDNGWIVGTAYNTAGATMYQPNTGFLLRPPTHSHGSGPLGPGGGGSHVPPPPGGSGPTP